MKQRILDLMQRKNYQPSDSFWLQRELKEDSKDRVVQALASLEAEGLIIRNKRQKYELAEGKNYARGDRKSVV